MLKIVTEVIRWVIVSLFLILVFRLVNTLIDPLFFEESIKESFRIIVDIALFQGVFGGIKKIQSILVLLIISLVLVSLIFLEDYITKLIKKS